MAVLRASVNLSANMNARPVAASTSGSRMRANCKVPRKSISGMRLRVARKNMGVATSRRSTRAEAETPTSTSTSALPSTFVPVLKPEELPKGDRQTIQTANNKSIMLFWYRNEIFAVESRSPAEGAYSNGFAEARLTQDYGIQCPSTGTTFNLKTGEIMEWYPNNPVLRAITPQDTCRPMEVFPVKLDQSAIYVDPVNTNLNSEDIVLETASTLGGANTSLENNNVFGLEPAMYLENGEALDDDSSGALGKVDPATLVISTVAVAIIAVAGSATCLYYENLIALGLLWIVGFGVVAYTILKLQDNA